MIAPRRSGPGAVPSAARAGIALLVVASAFALASLAGLEYKINDDVGMRFIAEAIIGEAGQSQFLIFQNVLVGLLLQALYSIAPALPWYDLLLAAGTIAGALLCELALLRLCTNLREMLFCAALGLTFFTPVFHGLQFTASAMLLGAGATLTVISLMSVPANTRLGLWAAAAALVVAFVAAAAVRFHGALLGMLLVLPLVALFGVIRRGEVQWAPVAALVCAFLASLLLQGWDNRYYANAPGWENFREHGREVVRAGEYAFPDRLQRERWELALAAARWSENDYLALSGWLFQNREVFSTERLRRFSDLAPARPVAERLALLGRRVLAVPENPAWIVPVFCLAALLRRSLTGMAGVLLSVVTALGAAAAMAVLFKSGFRHLLWPFYSVVALTGTAAIFGQRPRSAPQNGSRATEQGMVAAAVLVCVAGLMLSQIREVFARAASSDQLRRRVDHDVAAWPLRPDSVVIVWDHNFPFETWVRPFRAVDPMLRRFPHLNAPSLSPLLKPFYAQWGTSDAAWAMCHVPGVVRVADDRLGLAGPQTRVLESWMREHYQEEVEVIPAFRGEVLSLYACRALPAETGRRQ